MQISITVRRDHLRAVTVTAADIDVRYYLKGVLFEVYCDRAFMVSTDGHRLSVFRVDNGDALAGASGIQFIAPSSVIKVGSDKQHQNIVVTYDTETKLVSVNDYGEHKSAAAIEHSYPEWRRVIPKAVTGKPQQFNAHYLADLSKIAKLAKPGHKFPGIAIHHNGESGRAALVTMEGCPEFLGALMEIRGEPEIPDVDAFSAAPRSEDLAIAA
jgi:DNA polymerase-3 subunit beta